MHCRASPRGWEKGKEARFPIAMPEAPCAWDLDVGKIPSFWTEPIIWVVLKALGVQCSSFSPPSPFTDSHGILFKTFKLRFVTFSTICRTEIILS